MLIDTSRINRHRKTRTTIEVLKKKKKKKAITLFVNISMECITCHPCSSSSDLLRCGTFATSVPDTSVDNLWIFLYTYTTSFKPFPIFTNPRHYVYLQVLDFDVIDINVSERSKKTDETERERERDERRDDMISLLINVPSMLNSQNSLRIHSRRARHTKLYCIISLDLSDILPLPASIFPRFSTLLLLRAIIPASCT